MKIRKTIEEFAIITVGTIIVAIAVFFFMLPRQRIFWDGKLPIPWKICAQAAGALQSRA